MVVLMTTSHGQGSTNVANRMRNSDSSASRLLCKLRLQTALATFLLCTLNNRVGAGWREIYFVCDRTLDHNSGSGGKNVMQV